MKIAIIPARAGSIRIKNKNIKLFNGKPAIAWSILAAKKTNLFDRIIVSTDSNKITQIAKKYGAEVPFIRKKILAKNSVTTIKVIKDAIRNIKSKEAKICCIYPCAPLIKSKDISNSYKKLKKKIDFVFSASAFQADIFRSFILLKKNKKIKIINKKNFNKKSNYRIKKYYDSGQFYWGHQNSWIKKKDIFKSNVDIFEIPSWRSQDINTSDDWNVALRLSKIK